jgi:hypothetical protein
MLVASVKTAKANGLGRDGDARSNDGSGERREQRLECRLQGAELI